MSTALQHQIKPMTFDEYLVWEDRQPTKHEFRGGYAVAMSGGSVPHGTVALNICTALKTQLRGGRCRVYNSDVRLQVASSGDSFYPDVMVSCHFRDHNSTRYLSQPSVIVEVLSPSTAAYDRGDKFAQYRTLPSLQTFVLADPDARRVEVFHRDAQGHWTYEVAEGQGSVHLASIEVTLTLDAIFEDVPLPDADLAATEPSPAPTEPNG
jgi:Uma2 family endonuclease